MSKIIPISENQAIYLQGNVQQPSNDFFKRSLEKAMEAQKTTGASHTASLGEVRPTVFHQIDTPTENVALQTNQLLDLLDDYARNLKDPARSLKDIAPLLEEISSNTQNLLRETEKIPPTEEKLRGIASSAAIMAEVELIKFKRGDYI
ncbi:MAG: hypothetical protein V2B19_33050 [Pseudomonadota bacterium]